MAFKNWHYGKLIILWAWGIAVAKLIMQFSKPGIRSLIISAVIFGIAVTLSVITWKWLSYKQKQND